MPRSTAAGAANTAKPERRKRVHPTRRQFLRSAGALAASLGSHELAVGENPDDEPGPFVLKVQTKPEPRIVLPTDTLPPPTGPKLHDGGCDVCTVREADGNRRSDTVGLPRVVNEAH